MCISVNRHSWYFGGGQLYINHATSTVQWLPWNHTGFSGGHFRGLLPSIALVTRPSHHPVSDHFPVFDDLQ